MNECVNSGTGKIGPQDISNKCSQDHLPRVTTVKSPFAKNYVPISIDGSTFFPMLDTGADVSVINPCMLSQYKEFSRYQILAPDRKYIATATNQCSEITGMIVVKAVIDKQTVECKFYVVHHVQPTLILGLDFCQQNRATIKIRDDGLYLSLDPVWSVVVADDMTVPPKSQIIVLARKAGSSLPHEVIGTTTGSPSLAASGVRPTKSLSTNQNMRVHFGCANFSDKPVTAHKGTTIGKFTCVSPDDVIYNPDKGVNTDGVCSTERVQCSCKLKPQSAHILCHNLNTVAHITAHTAFNTTTDTTKSTISSCVDFTESDLNFNQQSQLSGLVDEFGTKLFVGPDNKLGHCDVIQRKINIADNHKPVRDGCYRLGPKQKQVLEHMIGDMQDQGIIEPSTSPWAAPCLLVAKKNNKGYRFVVDYRRINKLIEIDAHPLPTTEEALDSTCIGTVNPTYFSAALDLQSGFYQIALHPDSKQYTAFRCHLGLFQFRRLPMGLRSSPSTFQRVMEAVLHGFSWKHCLIYMDNILIFSQDFDSHLVHLREVFDRLSQAGLKLRPDKCKFAARKIHYLGHVVSKEGIFPDPDKISAVFEYPTPQNVKEVKTFLGLSSYYRKFIEGYPAISTPLYKLCKKGVPFRWSSQCQVAFNRLKDALTSPPVLAYPDFNLPFTLYTDASSFDAGGVLSQVQSGKSRVICYISRSLNPAERSYGILGIPK